MPSLSCLISPVPIIAIVLMLGTSRARSNGLAFALGWLAGLTIVGGALSRPQLSRQRRCSASRSGDQQAKTKTALEFFAAVLRERQTAG